MMIFVKEGKEAVFHQFEDLAIPILNDYRGKLIYRIRPTKETYISFEEELPYEIHFISFESEKDFIDFSKDARRTAFLHLKKDAIKYTFLVKGTEV
ncbi:hypothetical protein QLS71_004120 [Mariniflexile litorale]|uniref:DUF1330 domain-containing protein n=1 Tax=Mariniflexile litorale TaxID=3045158 RepID=A0AAU7EG97_9FLAO|nr:hypothetical protein [Mariniflexile sp. KMM 9835]MDQ8210206.1 hypothetical protein [Mariniflexile sp. KMM 9835]